MSTVKERAKKAIERITSGKTSSETITISTADDSISIAITGIHTKINLGVDQEGNIIQSKKAHISISEKILTDNNYPVRNTKGEVAISGHKIHVKDSTGIVQAYVIKTCTPDETVGLLTCILSDLEDEY